MVKLVWVPAHVGVWGNVKADCLAKKRKEKKSSIEKHENEVIDKLGRGEMKVLIRRAVVNQ